MANHKVHHRNEQASKQAALTYCSFACFLLKRERQTGATE
jgi:hypothetical protein